MYLKFTILVMTLSYIYRLKLAMPKHETKPLQLWRIVYVILELGCLKANDDRTEFIIIGSKQRLSKVQRVFNTDRQH